MARCNPEPGRYMTLYMGYRGEVEDTQVCTDGNWIRGKETVSSWNGCLLELTMGIRRGL